MTAVGSLLRSSIRPVVLLLGSFAVVLNLSVATHEAGHLVLDRANGLDAGLVLEPFQRSYTDLREPYPDDAGGWPIAAGPLANVGAGLVLFAALRRARNAYLVPLLLWGPVALLQESTTALVQLATNERGADFVLLVGFGAPEPVLMAAGAVGLLAGMVGLVVVLSSAGIAAGAPLRARAAMLACGMAGYPLLALLVSVTFGYASSEVSRNANLVLYSLVLAGLAAMLSGVPAMRRNEAAEVPWPAAVSAAVGGAAVVALLLVI